MGKYAALLRGINVGGNKKVPMSDLKKAFESAGFKNVKTLLNTGNIAFESSKADSGAISKLLEKKFGFSIPALVFDFSSIEKIIKMNPFRNVKANPGIRLYVTFLPEKTQTKKTYDSPDGSFHIIKVIDYFVFSYLDLSKTETPDSMEMLEKVYGKGITTRNWNTVVKISKL